MTRHPLIRVPLLVAAFAISCNPGTTDRPDGPALDDAPDGMAAADAEDNAGGEDDTDISSKPDAEADTANDTADDPGPSYPLDDVLRINHLLMKGTHNSYHMRPDPLLAVQWDYEHAPLDVQLGQQGVRQIELDIHWRDEEKGFLVHHIPAADEKSTCRTLPDCLAVIKGWSDAHRNHSVLIVLLEPKDDLDQEKIVGHYDDLDAAILAAIPRERIFTPDDMRRTHATLRETVTKDGWPTLGATRGRILFQLLDTGEHRDGYMEGHPNLEDRLMFARGGEDQTWGLFSEFGNPITNEEKIRQRALDGYMVRTFAVTREDGAEVGPAEVEAAVRSGAHFVSTDFPAKVTGQDVWFDLAGGTPSRCNPVTAPPECTPEAIE